jgi:hypothetical protein
MCHDESGSVRNPRQWRSWAQWIDNLCQQKRFKKAWVSDGSTFDEEFERYIRQRV